MNPYALLVLGILAAVFSYATYLGVKMGSKSKGSGGKENNE